MGAVVTGCGERPPAAARAGTASKTTTGQMENMPGMQLAGGGGTARLSADQIRQFGVTFDTAGVRTLASTVRAAGVVAVDEARVAQVAPKVGGVAERLYVAVTGQPVRRGQPLLELYSPELLAAQEELLVARRLDQTVGEASVPGVPAATTDLLGAARRRLRLLDVSDAQIAEVLRTGRARRTVTIYAPASGVVTEKGVVRGQAVQPGQSLYTVADLSRVWVEAALREADAASVRPGTAAEIELAAAPGHPLTGRVSYIYPVLDSTARAVRARIEVANPRELLKPGMYGTVRLTTPSRTALTVPASAVVHTGERDLVFVDMGGGELMVHEVVVGTTAGDYTEVLSGLERGQRVVTSAQFLLDAESNLAEVVKSMMGQMGASDTQGMQDMPGMNDKGADMRGMPGMTPPAATSPAPRR
ncbi:MAG: efflux RND transporter periplasmic adaptor subunit [Gemmatimonadaceae bacterium]